MALFVTKTKASNARRLTLAWEITIVLIIKFALLWLLWYFFFSAPKAKHMQLPEPQVTQHLISNNSVSIQHDR